VNFSNQIHDFDPGLTPNGVFWTVPVPKNSVYVHPGAGEAAVDVKNLAVQDFFSLPNFFTGGASAPAVVSFHIRWSGVTKRVKTRDVANGFAGEFIENSWSGQPKRIISSLSLARKIPQQVTSPKWAMSVTEFSLRRVGEA
jgi:hypothetical protein